MSTLLEEFRSEVALRSVFFQQSRQEIADTNLSLLRKASLFGVAIILVLMGVAYLIIPGWMPTPVHGALLLFFCIMLVACDLVLRRGSVSYSTSTFFCVATCAILLVSSVWIDCIPSPSSPESLTAIVLMVVPLFFAVRMRVIAALSGCTAAFYVVMMLVFKDPLIWPHDLFTVLFACLACNASAWVIMGLRVRDNSAKLEYKHLSSIDMLTGIMNKSTLEQCRQVYLRTRKASDICALIIIDFDDFKVVNDTRGHKCGDELLRCMGVSLLKVFRQNDMVGRIGGDEFCVFMNNVPSCDVVEQRVHQLQADIHDTAHDCLGFDATFCAGVAITPSAFVSDDELFCLADAALYEAKAQKGKGALVVKQACAIQTSAAEGDGRKVMIIADDREVNRITLASVFADTYQLVMAENGGQVLESLSYYGRRVEVVLLDLIMPVMDGFEVLAYMKDAQKLRNIPVVVVTGDEACEARALGLGAADVLPKPIDPVVARLRVQKAIDAVLRSQ